MKLEYLPSQKKREISVVPKNRLFAKEAKILEDLLNNWYTTDDIKEQFKHAIIKKLMLEGKL